MLLFKKKNKYYLFIIKKPKSEEKREMNIENIAKKIAEEIL